MISTLLRPSWFGLETLVEVSCRLEPKRTSNGKRQRPWGLGQVGNGSSKHRFWIRRDQGLGWLHSVTGSIVPWKLATCMYRFRRTGHVRAGSIVPDRIFGRERSWPLHSMKCARDPQCQPLSIFSKLLAGGIHFSRVVLDRLQQAI